VSEIVVKSARLGSGLTLPYAESAAPGGVPVVLVHGIADSWRTFGPLLAHLPATLHAFAPTQRGHGDADRPPTGYRPDDFADDLVGFLDAVGLTRAVLVGASSGGVAARIAAGRHPDRSAGLVLVGVPAELADKPGIAEVGRLLDALVDPVGRGFVEGFLSGMTARPMDRELLETVVEDNLKVPARVWRETMRGLLETDLPATLTGITVPTLVLWGDRDAVLPRTDQQRILDAVPGSGLTVLEGAGHVAYWDRPERVAAELAAFAARVMPAG